MAIESTCHDGLGVAHAPKFDVASDFVRVQGEEAAVYEDSVSLLDQIKSKAPWRRRQLVADSIQDCVTTAPSSPTGDIACDEEDKFASPTSMKESAEITLGVSCDRLGLSDLPPQVSNRAYFTKNTFIELTDDSISTDGAGEFPLRDRWSGANSDCGVDYSGEDGSAGSNIPLTDDSVSINGGNTQHENEPCADWWKNPFPNPHAGKASIAESLVPYQPSWYYFPTVNASGGEVGYQGQQGHSADSQGTIQFVQAAADFAQAYAMVDHFFTYDGFIMNDFGQQNVHQGYARKKRNNFVGRSVLLNTRQWRTETARERSSSVEGGSSGSASTSVTSGDYSARNRRRTNIVLRNIPPGFTRAMLIELLDREGFACCYDLVYLPCDFVNENSLGYAFVILTSEQEAERAIAHFEGFNRWKLPSKVCKAEWGREGADLRWHIQRYRDSTLMHHSVQEHLQPALFRNGVRVPFPQASGPIDPPRTANRWGQDDVRFRGLLAKG
eukprot:TRINITY_DN74260_c0_g1_i1.p1 TRINITY_DN74260_c0_g1~~TRINITY_DN74260_c0_g1_i1.p1  ORF type:complete len:498 (-),score=68.74 TRINITY_DN74260_c0_g1_i1:33-1526(-)